MIYTSKAGPTDLKPWYNLDTFYSFYLDFFQVDSILITRYHRVLAVEDTLFQEFRLWYILTHSKRFFLENQSLAENHDNADMISINSALWSAHYEVLVSVLLVEKDLEPG